MFKIFINLLLILSVLCLIACSGIPKMKSTNGKSQSANQQSTDIAEKEIYDITEQDVQKFEPKFKVSKKTAAAYNSALEHMRNKNYEIAIQEMQRVARMDKRISGPWVNIGLAYKGLGNEKLAIESFEKALIINPSNSYAFNYLGILSRENGEFKKAESLYKKAISAYPNYQNAHLNLGILCDMYLRKIDCALKHYQEYLRLSGGKDKQVGSWVSRLQNQGG